MTLRQCCDVFGTAKDVSLYRIRIEKEKAPPETGDWVKVSEVTVWYCPRGLKRAVNFLGRALLPPTAKKETSDSS